jgi:GT2 family glycosyltransferase
MVTRNPGPRFDEVLGALAAQDYSNLAVLVIDAASDADPTPRVAAVLPDAYVRRLEHNPGFGAAANHVREIVEGAAFYCFLHDDAAPTEKAVSTLVGEALRSNAGIVGPKLVHFDDPRRILQVGEAVDKTGERVGAVEPGELDQEQHDAIRDVFVVPGACTLVRSDLFEAVDGFDPGIDALNDDLNLCWRAHVAGARVIVAPDAVVRHEESLGVHLPEGDRRERLMRHRIRTMLSCYSRMHLLRVVPQAVVVSVLEVVYSLLVGRAGQARDVIRAWRWNLGRRDEISAWRRKVEAFRTVPDPEIRRFQLRGFARLSRYVRGQGGARGGSRSDQAQASLRHLRQGLSDGHLRWPVAAWLVTLVIVGVGSRHLLLRPIPAVGSLPAFDLGPFDLFRSYLSGWRDVGLGTSSPAPSGIGLLGALGTAFLGAMGTLRRVLLLGALVAGLVGAYRLLRPTTSPRAQAAALVVYGAIPLGYDAIADARWGALTVYGATPWIFGHLARAGGWAPFDDPARRSRARRPRDRILGLAVLLALVAAIDPAVVPVTGAIALGLAGGSLLLGRSEGNGRLTVVVAGAAATTVLLHFPWSLELLLPGATWETVVGTDGAEPSRSLVELLRFDVGPVGASAISIGLPLAALLPLFIGREWRFDWAVRAWTVAIVLVGLTWAGGEGWLPLALPPAETMLAGAAMALALATAMGVVAFEVDLSAYGFGWRQVVAALAGIAFLVGALPTMLDAGNGRWYLPGGGLETTFAFLDQEEPGFRVLWVGDPDVLPLPGYRLDGEPDDDLAYATSDDGLPSITDHWPGSADGPTQLIEDSLALASAGETSRLGRIVAPMAVRYIVLPRASAPRPLGGLERPLPHRLVETLDAQLDLVEVPVNPAYVVYRNEAALPARSVLSSGAGERSIFESTPGDLADAEPVLGDRTGATTHEGTVSAGSLVLHSVAANDGWQLEVDGRAAPDEKLFGWAQGFDTDTGGDAVLRYETGLSRYGVVALQALFWAIALVALLRARDRRTAAPELRATGGTRS